MIERIKTGIGYVPVFFLIAVLFLFPRPLFAGESGDGTAADPFASPVRYEDTRAEIEKIGAGYRALTDEIAREEAAITQQIIEADDPGLRKALLERLAGLEQKHRDALAVALSAVGDLRVKDGLRHLEETVKAPVPAYMDKDRLLAGDDLSGLFGSNADLSGYLKLRVTEDLSIDNPNENLFETEIRARLALKYPINDRLSVYLSGVGRFDYMTGGGTRYDHEFSLDEAYIDVFFDKVDIRVGNQIVAWGRTDVLNPTDNINPLNLNNILTGDISEKKVPTFAVKLDYYYGDTTAELVMVPFFQEHTYDLVGSDWAIFHYNLLTDYVGGQFPWSSLVDERAQSLINRLAISATSPIKPTDSPENIQGGIRISSKFRGWDFSVSYLNMYDRLPTVRLSEGLIDAIQNGTVQSYIASLSPGELSTLVSLDYHRYHMVGFDFATTVNSWGIRGEAGVFLDRYTYTKNLEAVKDNYIYYVVGVDRLFKGDFYVNLQFVQKIILDWGHDYIEDEYQNALTLYAYKEFEVMDRKFVPELRLIYDINGDDYFLTPKVTYKWSDTLEFALGVNLFEGYNDTLFGYFKNNDQAFFEVKYIF